MAYHIAALEAAITDTLEAIQDGKEQVELIAKRTWEEVQQIEAEYEAIKQECLEAIHQVEVTEHQSRVARERLIVVNRGGAQQFSEKTMKQAYDEAHEFQVELGRWREREIQLRMRRDELARRLKSLRITAHEAETLMVKFNHISDYLTTEFGELASTLQTAQLDSLVGLQVMQMQEDERRNLAQRLHDGPMQGLASVAMKAQLLSVEPEKEPLKEEVRFGLNGILGNIRQIVFDLHPPLLDDLGLIPALRRYTQQWAEWVGVKVKVNLIGVEAILRPTEKMTIFRTVQEALKNVSEHAGASSVEVSLIYGVDKLTVEVLDDGEGIAEVDWYNWVSEGKLGLTMSKQRLSLLNGTLDIQPANLKGTKVIIELPISRSGK